VNYFSDAYCLIVYYKRQDGDDVIKPATVSPDPFAFYVQDLDSRLIGHLDILRYNTKNI
jgi:hypothetical protein